MTSISGGISFSGLGSGGLDFEAMISQEKTIKEIPKKRLEAWQADWKLRYDAFDKLLTSVQTLSDKLSNLSSINTFMQKKTSSTNASVGTVTANANAADGTYAIDVKQLATNAVLTSNHVFSSKKDIVTGAAQPPVFSYDYKGKTYSLSIPENCELDYLVTKINGDQNNPGVTASLLKTGNGYVFQLQGKETGANADLSINSATNLPAFSVSPTSSSTLTSGLVTGPDAVLTDKEASFTYSDGTYQYTYTLQAGDTAQKLVDSINAGNTNVTASLVKNGSGYSIQLQSADGSAISVDDSDNLNMKWSTAAYTRTWSGTVAGTDLLNPKDATGDVDFAFLDRDGNEVVISLAPGDDVNALVKKINEQRGTSGVKAMLVSDGAGGTRLQLEKDDGSAVTVTRNGTSSSALDPAGWNTDVTPVASWNKRDAQDAIFSVNDLDMEFMSESNTLSEVFAGLEVTLLSTGKTQFTVTTSTEDTKKKVEEFVEAYNDLVKAFQEADNYDEDKTVKTRAASKDEKGNYVIDYSSQFSYQKGGVLTGNYGVQTIMSEIKQLISGRGAGFRPMNDVNDTLGDRYINLSSIGIMVDTDQSSSTFGQLKFLTDEERLTKGGGASDADKNPYRTLDMALEEDPQAVMDLLVGSGGVSDSPKFSYKGSIGASIAPTPGEYNVSYTVDTAGTPPAFIIVDGVKIMRDDESGSYVVPSGPLGGVEISVDDLSAGAVSGTLRIKQGKIPQLAAKLKDELRNDPLLKDPETGLYGVNTKRGGLIILKENYKTIMDNIQKKIDQETTRLQTWEKRQRLRYSRLDTLLGSYENIMNSNASALATANNNSSNS